MLKFFSKIVGLFFLILFFPLATNAARIYFDPSEVSMGPGDSMELKVKVDVDDACINTVDAKIEYPSDYVYVREFTTGDSILSIWVNQPSSKDIETMNRLGKIEFTGGIPGGYCGRIPGDPGESNIIGRIIFTVPSLIVADEDRDELAIKFSDETKVYLNDGLGTEATLVKGLARVTLAKNKQIEDYQWRDSINEDKTSPEPFVIELMQNPALFGGAYHINFSTVDKQTGVDRYEILEIKPNEEIGVKPKLKWWERLFGGEILAPEWVVDKMPYVLKDQTLSSVVKVRAIDKAGNERLVEYVPPSSMRREFESTSNILVFVIGLGIMVVFVLIVWLIIRTIKKLKNKSRSQREKNNYEEEKNSSLSDSDNDTTE